MSVWARVTGAFTIAGTTLAGVGIALSAGVVPGVTAAPVAPEPAPATVTVTQEQVPESHPPEEVSDLDPDDSGAIMDESMFVSTYDTASATTVELVQRPDEFLPPRITGEGPAEVLAMNIGWAHWDAEKAIGNCTVRVTGGGSEPTLHEGVRLTLDQPEERGGVRQYTRYRLDWPTGEPSDVGELDFSS